MKTLVYVVLGYAALYSVIWLHEVGHAFFYQLYGCKRCFLHVTVKPYLFFSTPRPVDEELAGHLPPRRDLVVSYGGIGVNLAAALVTGVILSQMGKIHPFLHFFLLQFLTLHLAEMVSYLVIGNLYLVSDMKNISDICPRLRIVNFCIGLLICVPYFAIFWRIPEVFFPVILFYNAVTILCMGIGRVIFTKFGG